MNSDATRTVVMTGATRGLGKVAALKILSDAPDVHLVLLARSGGDNLAADLSARSGNPHVSTVHADLNSVVSTRAAAATIREDLAHGKYPPLFGFVGNAGLQLLRANDPSPDGIETTFAVNVLANFVLIEELRPVLAAPSRIVLTTSDTHFGDFKHNMGMVPAPVWRDPAALATPGTADAPDTPAAGRRAYSTSKLAVIYLVHALAQRLDPATSIYAFNPGFVPGTGLVRDGGAAARFAFRWVMPAMTATPWARSIRKSGADLAAAAIGASPDVSGSYLNGTKTERSSDQSYDPHRETLLWNTLQKLATEGIPPVPSV